ncbi:MAG: MFS transporter [Chloroflexi bacterium]|nr:MFS transporter [Chloroflexota bacterium]
MEDSAFRAAMFNPARMRRRLRGVFYGWWLVPISGIVHMTTSVPLFHAMGLWFVALESAFGWNRTQLSLAFSFTRIEGGILGPIEGYLVDRLGVRRMVLIGLSILGLGFLLFSQVRDTKDIPVVRDLPFELLPGFMHIIVPALMFYIVFMIMALGQGLSGWLTMNTMLNNWFTRHKAKAMGYSSAIGRLGALVLIPAIAWAVDPEQDNFGWSMTALLLGVVTLVMVIPISRLIRNRPEDYGLLPDGDKPVDTPAGSPTNASTGAPSASRSDRPAARRAPPSDGDFSLRDAMRTPTFWLISFGQGFTSMVLIAMMAHLAPMLWDQGVSVPMAGWVVSTYTAMSMIFQIVGGYVGDMISKRFAYFCFTSIQAGAVVVLVFVPELAALLHLPSLVIVFAFAILFGIGFGGRNPISTSIRGEYFGRSSFGKIMGMSQVPMNVMLLGAPIYPAILHDAYGSYDFAFLSLAFLNFIGGAMFLLAKKPVKPVRRQVSGVR